jgi:hypothetical protein
MAYFVAREDQTWPLCHRFQIRQLFDAQRPVFLLYSFWLQCQSEWRKLRPLSPLSVSEGSGMSGVLNILSCNLLSPPPWPPLAARNLDQIIVTPVLHQDDFVISGIFPFCSLIHFFCVEFMPDLLFLFASMGCLPRNRAGHSCHLTQCAIPHMVSRWSANSSHSALLAYLI